MAKDFALVPLIHALPVSNKKLGNPVTDLDSEVYPQGIYDILKQFSDYKNIRSLIITENGASFPDTLKNRRINYPERTKFLQDYLKQILRAKRDGVNVNGYFVWSLLDNFEWNEGFRPRFGIVYNDYTTQQRIVKDSGKWFADFLKK